MAQERAGGVNLSGVSVKVYLVFPCLRLNTADVNTLYSEGQVQQPGHWN